MAASEGYTVPGQNGDTSASKDGEGQAGLGRSSEPTFSAALTVWKGEEHWQQAMGMNDGWS